MFTRFPRVYPRWQSAFIDIPVESMVFERQAEYYDALAILKTLSGEDTRLRERIESMIIDLLGEVDLDELAGEVFYKLDAIQVEDLWDRSGNTRHGYVEPCEESWEMFDEALELFLRDQERFKNLGQIQQAQKYGMAILQGIYRFAHESKSKFKDWAEDAPLD